MVADEVTVSALDGERSARAAALHEARRALSAKAGFTSSAVDPIDLVSVASWIMDGEDPYDIDGIETGPPDDAVESSKHTAVADSDLVQYAPLRRLLDTVGLPLPRGDRNVLAWFLADNGVVVLPETLTDEQARVIGSSTGWNGQALVQGRQAWPAIRAALIGGEPDE